MILSGFLRQKPFPTQLPVIPIIRATFFVGLMRGLMVFSHHRFIKSTSQYGGNDALIHPMLMTFFRTLK